MRDFNHPIKHLHGHKVVSCPLRQARQYALAVVDLLRGDPQRLCAPLAA